jgi:inorganic triphosphatase YgiF
MVTRHLKEARTPATPIEVEAKLLVPSERQLRAIAAARTIGAYRVAKRDAKKLHSVYLDTPDLILSHHAVALRLRRESGRWKATVKWAGRVDGAVHERPELTIPLAGRPRYPFALTNQKLRLSLGALVAGCELRPVLITDIHRRRFDVLAAEPKQAMSPVVAELALDRIQLRAPRDRRRIRMYNEVEIELIGGSKDDLNQLVRCLRRQFNAVPSKQSKLATGLALLYGTT